MSAGPLAENDADALEVVFVDTSALLRRYITDRERPLVLNGMKRAAHWATSAMARTEVQLALHQAAASPSGQRALWAAVRDDWEAFWVVPVDGRCLARTAEIGARYGLATVDAIPLAAASRLPGAVGFLTFERQQIPAAAELGLHVISPYDF